MTDIQPSMLPDVPDIPLARLPGGSLDALERLRSAIGQMDARRADLAAQGDWDTLAHALSGIRALIRDLRTVEAATVADVAGLLPEKRVTVDGLGTIERRTPTIRREWQSTDLARAVALRALIDEQTGELRYASAADAAGAVVDALVAAMPVTPSLGWRIGALREQGFDPDEWCASSRGPAGVTIHGDTAADR